MAGSSLVAGIAGVLGARMWLNRRMGRPASDTSPDMVDDRRRQAAAQEAALHDAAQAVARLEGKLSKKEDLLGKREHTLVEKERALTEKLRLLQQREDELQEARERVAGLTSEDARRELLACVEKDLVKARAKRIRAAVEDAEATAETRARDIVLTAMQRLGGEASSDAAVSRIALPAEDLKGRIIGREGRNIRAFEAATGCDLLIDDPPGYVAVSSFDGVRRAVARRALVRLLDEGRMQPDRIEEVVAEERARTDKRIVEAGRAAAAEAGAHELDDELVGLLGRLHYRTSYGQNVLRHAVEVAHLAGLMAAELGLDPVLARRAGLLHDIGKAIDQEAEGSHHAIAGRVLRRLGERAEVIDAAAGHHEAGDQVAPYTALTQVADAISAARPGARRENVERFVARAKELEGIATSFDGVKRAYAVEAGRALRVLVDADVVGDDAAAQLAFDLARAIEGQIDVPGEVRVTVIRETRATEIAH